MTMLQATIESYRPLPDLFRGKHCKDDIRKLLENSGRTLEKEGVLDQLIKLGDWIESLNRTRPDNANDGITCLQDMRDRLNQKADELIRLEGEGGRPATDAQEQEIADLNRAIKRIDHMIGLVEGKQIS